MNDDNFKQIMRYHDIIKLGKKAELHFQIRTGIILCFHTVSPVGEIGNGTPWAPLEGWLVIC